MDSSSWSLTLAASKQLEKVMIALTTRPMEPGKTPFEYGIIVHQHHTHQILLKNLPENSIGALIAQLVGIDESGVFSFFKTGNFLKLEIF